MVTLGVNIDHIATIRQARRTVEPDPIAAAILAELEAWLAELPEGELLVDTWEQPIARPQEDDEQEAYYSGKKKMHTRKNR